MPVNKNQLQRLIRLVGELKENRYPNCVNFAAKITDDNGVPACTAKTIQRDLKMLRDEFECPLDFSREFNGYYLKHHGWNFPAMQLFDEHEMLAAILGAKLAEDIFPEPLKSHIREAVDAMLANNNPDFLDSAIVKSLNVIPGLCSNIIPAIFMPVFAAWQERKALKITYVDIREKVSQRTIEPHALVYYESSWYIKSVCLLRNKVRNFAIHRITAAEKLQFGFNPNPAIINSIINDNFLEYKRVSHIKILCNNEIKTRIAGKPLHRAQLIEAFSKTQFILHIPAMPEHELLQWILSQAGNVQLLEPDKLCQKIKIIAKNIAALHNRT
jgi:predicted DNA-binding transcriptional regulator YafY